MKPTTPLQGTPKTYGVKSFGCQMNVYDGERGIAPAQPGKIVKATVG